MSKQDSDEKKCVDFLIEKCFADNGSLTVGRLVVMSLFTKTLAVKLDGLNK